MRSSSIGLLLALSAIQLPGQRYFFREYRQEHGLANLVVTALLQDRDKYLWIGTQNGLYRYDGIHFRPYGRSQGLPGAFIVGLAAGPDGSLWVSTPQGLGRLRDSKATTELRFQAGTEEPNLGLGVAPNGDVFAASGTTLWRGRRNPEGAYEFRPLKLPSQHDGRPILQIAIDQAGQAFFGCGMGLCTAGGMDEVRYVGNATGLPAAVYRGAVFDAAGRLYVLSSLGVYCRRSGQAGFEKLRGSKPGLGTGILFAGAKGDLYVPAKDGLAIWKAEAKTWQFIKESQAIPADRLAVVFEDHEESLWLGFLGDGLKRWLGYREWEGYNKEDGLPSDQVWSLTRDERGVLWAGTEAGLGWFEEQSRVWRSLGGAKGAAWGRIYSLAKGPGSLLYAISLKEGIIEVETTTRRFRVLGKPAAWPVRLCYSLLRGKDGVWWIGTSDGLFRAPAGRPMEWTRAAPADYQADEAIFTVTEDRSGGIWAAGNRGLLQSTDSGRSQWKRWTEKEGMRTSAAWYAREGKPGEIWVGYLESLGLSRLRIGEPGVPPKWFHITERDMAAGLETFIGYFVGLDREGRHWVGTDRGAFMISGPRNEARHYTDQDGLIWNDCNSNAFYADRDGGVWIGTSRGLAHATLSRASEKRPGGLQLTRMMEGSKATEMGDLPAGKPILLPSPPNQVELEVSPMTFRFESRLQYRFRLRSAGDNWAVSRSNQMAFSQLSAGEDAIEAQVKVDRGKWSESLVVPLQVRASFWQSWLGRGLLGIGALLAIGAAGVLLWRYRTQRLLGEKMALEAAVAERTVEIERLLTEARQANRLKSEFLANMSHEIRTPMNGVLGTLQLIEDSPLDGEQKALIDLAKESAGGLLRLLNEILDLGKVESGHVSLENRDFDLSAMLRQVIGLLEAVARQKGLRLELVTEGAVDGLVLGDEYRLQQVLLNLVGNAIKFTDAGLVTLRVVRRETELCEFRVEDQGIGIAPEKHAEIFEAFRQADGSTTRRFGGTGLGLAISQRLVRLMGGVIELESSVGQGSCFHFLVKLPRLANAAGAEFQAPEPAPEASDAGRLRVLLAEDNAINQLVASRLIGSFGHEVEVVADGAQAIEAVQRHRYDLVLMDVHMPEVDGLSATRQIRDVERLAGMERHFIVALTAGVMDEEKRRCLDAGMDGFLAKPVVREEVMKVLAQAHATRDSNPGAIEVTMKEYRIRSLPKKL